MSDATFEVYQDRADEWRWRLVHDNGNVIADSGQGYTTRQSALDGIESVKRNAPEATVIETSTTTVTGDDDSGDGAD